MAAEVRQGKRQKQHQRSTAPVSSTSSSMRGGSGRNFPRRRRPKRTKSEAQVGGEGGRRRWAKVGGDLQRGRLRSSRRAPTQVAFTAGGAGGKPRHRCKRVAALSLVAGWATVLVLVAVQVGSRRWLQGAGDGGGGRKEMDFFVTCLKLCGIFCKKTNTLPCGQLFPDGGNTS